MTDETSSSSCKCGSHKKVKCGAGGGVYGLAFIGAAVYYIQHADTFWMGALGILKAIIWPAMVIYKVLEFFGM
ncbi:MAG: hypothetical protein PHT44_04265 [Candidatus Portnoybacteria bacterium]|nr:hypothetical protein [Candidatus Portnoybacteria bacterium]MDD4983124.1 hypothetical protein [Candidatus Portnoybacteria bacterium]